MRMGHGTTPRERVRFPLAVPPPATLRPPRYRLVCNRVACVPIQERQRTCVPRESAVHSAPGVERAREEGRRRLVMVRIRVRVRVGVRVRKPECATVHTHDGVVCYCPVHTHIQLPPAPEPCLLDHRARYMRL